MPRHSSVYEPSPLSVHCDSKIEGESTSTLIGAPPVTQRLPMRSEAKRVHEHVHDSPTVPLSCSDACAWPRERGGGVGRRGGREGKGKVKGVGKGVGKGKGR